MSQVPFTHEEYKEHCVELMKALNLPDWAQAAFEVNEKAICYSRSPKFMSTFLCTHPEAFNLVYDRYRKGSIDGLPYYVVEFPYRDIKAYIVFASLPFKEEWESELDDIKNGKAVGYICTVDGAKMCNCHIEQNPVMHGNIVANGLKLS